MSASTRVQVLADKAEELSLLAQFLKDPAGLITGLQEEIKKLNSLTADEEAKLLQARVDLKEHNNKMFTLKKERELLEADKAAHEEHVEHCNTQIRTQTESIAIATDKQLETKKAQDAKDKAHAEERKQLDVQAAALKTSTEAAESILLSREEKVHIVEELNERTRVMLEADKKKLAEKLRFLQEE